MTWMDAGHLTTERDLTSFCEVHAFGWEKLDDGNEIVRTIESYCVV